MANRILLKIEYITISMNSDLVEIGIKTKTINWKPKFIQCSVISCQTPTYIEFSLHWA